MRILVTGGSGFLGRHLVRQIGDRHDVASPTSGDLDVRDVGGVSRAFAAFEPDAVIHTAYRKPDWDTNVDGSANIARACADSGVRLVHLSTDVVFGDRLAPWTELDRPCPAHDYGRSKAAAEDAVAEFTGAVIVRTSLLYGDRDLAAIQRDVADAIGGRSTMCFFDDELRCPIHADDLARAIVRLVTDLSDVTGPLHVAGPETLTRADLAACFARHLGLDERAVPVANAAELGLDASRPLRVVLDSSQAERLGIVARPIEAALGVAR